MFNFDEKAILTDHENGVALIPKTEEIVDGICKKGYKNICYLGIGGTILYANQFMHILKQLGSDLPIFSENAADYIYEGNHKITSETIVVLETVSGDTKELVEAVKLIKKVGAKVIGYVEKEGSPIHELCDECVISKNCAYYFWYTVTFRFLKNAGEYKDYDKLFGEIKKSLPKAVVGVYKQADETAKTYADKYCDEPITYLVGSGNLEDWAVCYGMCIMEEMQWMRTRPISAANFFHGTLEVVERDIPVILIKGVDKTRPQMDRVEKFVNTISAKVTVFDTKVFDLPGISDEFRWILDPIIMRSAFQRVNVHLEHNRRHPLPIRRYYRRLDY